MVSTKTCVRSPAFGPAAGAGPADSGRRPQGGTPIPGPGPGRPFPQPPGRARDYLAAAHDGGDAG